MSLRLFHLVFISLSVVLSAFVAAWAASEYRVSHDAAYAVGSVGSLAGAGALAIYGAVFQRKTRNL